MSWNYRVLRKGYIGLEYTYAIHEVYYDENGKPVMCTENPVCPMGENPIELKEDLDRYRQALGKPILDYYQTFQSSEDE